MNRLSTAALAAGVSILALISQPTQAAEVYRLIDPKAGNIIVINGDLTYDTPQKVRYALNKFNNDAAFVINSRGGSTLVARALQQMVIDTSPGSKVTVPAYGVCASACVDVLFIAHTIQVHQTAKIGVHLGQSYKTGRIVADEQANRVYRARGVPESVIHKMNTTPPSGIAWLTAAEFQSIPGASILTHAPFTIGDFIDRAQYRVGLVN